MATGAMFTQQNPEGRTRAMNAKVLTALIAGFSSIATAFITAYYTADNKVAKASVTQSQQISNIRETTSDQINSLSASTAGPLARGQKLCRVLQKNTWRDGVIVPQDWSVSTCVDYQKKTGGTAYQLGCIYTDDTTLGKEDGSFPSPNCGWR
jgi:hypothetical protein